ncbi:nucleoside hydrolase [Bacillus sp. DTU_2020_1000418_1_SI_GHA_SEK_038]|uniref:nucleoside hydrolase n=1 Tax=Bacillus sp. DTU_2020_1000418_1_SI_GHA_SEK_038 TaxID=3077585 RepID=UPI0028EE6281|nr:nucleoside hydrolase [Bacillus sp. DTU_2020_1000418_1_SI_GHA_SEK_038]WNS75185.1 nucleoside hydrolase [Bacillus sp. DTU_2020_1000418_1_SI_GHA_SEK_038]
MLENKKRKIILDCDPGHDDAIAILLAAGNPNIELVGITTVAGNAEVEKTTANALKVCEIAGMYDVPVFQGSGQPLVRKRETAPDIHGDSGMDGPVLPEATKTIEEEHAVDFIIRKLMESDGDITLVPTGPLTNIAMAMRREPAILSKIQEIVIMGGGTFGNWTPAAEFNIYVDAEAAKVVFESGAPITMMGLDLTHQALATHEVCERIAAIDNPVAQFVNELLVFFRKTYLEVFGFEHPPVHDICCVAYCIDPSVVETKKLRVDVETTGVHTYGMTLVDMHGVTDREPNVNVALKLDHAKFWNMVTEALQSYTKK